MAAQIIISVHLYYASAVYPTVLHAATGQWISILLAI